MFLPRVGRDPSQGRDSRPKPPKKLSSHRPSRNRTTAVYMPYQSATGIAQGQMSYQLVATGACQGPFAAVATQTTAHLPQQALGASRQSSSDHSSSSYSSSVTSCNAAHVPVGHLSWGVNGPTTLSTRQQSVLQQHNAAVSMQAHSGQPCALQGVQTSVQGATWLVPVSSSSTCAPPAAAHNQPLPAAAHPPAYSPYMAPVSTGDCSIASSYNIWGPVSDQHTAALVPAHCMPATCSSCSSTGPQPAPAAAAQLVTAGNGHPCSAQLLQQPASSGHMLVMPPPLGTQQLQQMPQGPPSSGSTGSTGMPPQGMLAVGLQDTGLMLSPAYSGNTAQWLSGPVSQPQHAHQQGQQQQQHMHLAVPVSGGGVGIGRNLPPQHVLLSG